MGLSFRTGSGGKGKQPAFRIPQNCSMALFDSLPPETNVREMQVILLLGSAPARNTMS